MRWNAFKKEKCKKILKCQRRPLLAGSRLTLRTFSRSLEPNIWIHWKHSFSKTMSKIPTIRLMVALGHTQNVSLPKCRFNANWHKVPIAMTRQYFLNIQLQEFHKWSDPQRTFEVWNSRCDNITLEMWRVLDFADQCVSLGGGAVISRLLVQENLATCADWAVY